MQRLDGLRRVDDHLAALVDHFPAVAPDDPMREVVAIAHGLAQREASGFAFGLQGLAHLQELVRLLGEFREAGLLEHAVAIEDSIADRGERQGDELVVLLGVAFEAGIIPAIAGGEVGCDIRHVEELVGILERIVEPDQHDVRTRAHIGGDGGLGADILPALLVDPHFDARRLSEFLGVGKPGILVPLHEGRPAQHP